MFKFRKKKVDEIIVRASDLEIGDKLIWDSVFVEVIKKDDQDEKTHVALAPVTPREAPVHSWIYDTIFRNQNVLVWR